MQASQHPQVHQMEPSWQAEPFSVESSVMGNALLAHETCAFSQQHSEPSTAATDATMLEMVELPGALTTDCTSLPTTDAQLRASSKLLTFCLDHSSNIHLTSVVH